MRIRLSYSVVATALTPILACCVSAHAPSVLHVRMLPHQDVVGYWQVKGQPVQNDKSFSNFRAQAFVTGVRVTHESACSPSEYYTEDSSSRDAIFQQCVNRLTATVMGYYHLRDGKTNHLSHYSLLKGSAEIPHFFYRSSGDLELIPKDKYEVQPQALWASNSSAISLALQDFTRLMEQTIRQQLVTPSTTVMFQYD